MTIRVGTAGWTLPRAVQERFPDAGSHLARYASVFAATEINSSFHRPHRPATYARWASSVPEHFRFSVKVPKALTHERRLAGTSAALDIFLGECTHLGARLACLLVQLPPSLALDAATAGAFLAELRERYAGDVALEPRHPSWFEPEAAALLERYRVARVAADPARVPHAAEPGGWTGLAYWRLHGSPRMYWSSYPEPALDALAAQLRSAAARADAVWCIFDNTTSGAAAANALDLLARLA